MLVFEWDDSGSNPCGMTQVYLSLYTERETCVIPEGFEPESFPLKYNPTTFEYKTYSIEADLYCLKYL